MSTMPQSLEAQGTPTAARYTKKVEITDTGMVFASVFRADGSRCGLQFFDWPPFSLRRRAIRAHAWADEHIATCEEYEVLPARSQPPKETP